MLCHILYFPGVSNIFLGKDSFFKDLFFQLTNVIHYDRCACFHIREQSQGNKM